MAGCHHPNLDTDVGTATNAVVHNGCSPSMLRNHILLLLATSLTWSSHLNSSTIQQSSLSCCTVNKPAFHEGSCEPHADAVGQSHTASNIDQPVPPCLHALRRRRCYLFGDVTYLIAPDDPTMLRPIQCMTASPQRMHMLCVHAFLHPSISMVPNIIVVCHTWACL